jgi:RimJ/RimL family protein N-acetyltransferase
VEPEAVEQASRAERGTRVVLGDGSEVLVGQVRPEDAPLLADGFARLSAESRQLRFLTDKPRLSPAEVRYFTEIDHHDHEAIGAMDLSEGRGVGIARYIRDRDDPEVAEIAVTVVDDWQGRGLGTELLTRLMDRAREEGIKRFRALVATDNELMLKLLHDIGGDLRVTDSGAGVVDYELTPPGRRSQMHELLSAFGRRQLAAPGTRFREALEALVPEQFHT